MKASQVFLEELEMEGQITRKFLERVSFDKADFQLHEKSEKLGRLATHVAEIMAWWKSCVEDDYLDFIDFEPENIDNTVDLLSFYDGLFAEAKKALANAKDANLEGEWSMK